MIAFVFHEKMENILQKFSSFIEFFRKKTIQNNTSLLNHIKMKKVGIQISLIFIEISTENEEKILKIIHKQIDEADLESL